MGLTTDMQNQTFLFKRETTYYLRRKIPVELQPYYGKVEIKISLKTKDRKEAGRLVRQKSADLDQEFDRLRNKVAKKSPQAAPVVDESMIQSVCEAWRHCALDGDDWYRQQGLSETEFDQLTTDRRSTDADLRQLLARGQVERIRPALQQFLSLLGVELNPDDPQYQRLAYRFLQSLVETSSDTLRRSQGDVVPTSDPPQQIFSENASGRLTIDSLFEDWRRQYSGGREKTVDNVRAVVRDFKACIKKSSAQDIAKSDIHKFRDHLLYDLKQHWKTVDKKLSLIRAVFQVAVDDEKLQVNPACRIKIPKPSTPDIPRLPFEIGDLELIFSSALYKQGERPLSGAGEAAVWLAVLALFTGNREEELGQLCVEDVRCDGGIWYLNIVDTGGEDAGVKRKLKNSASRRKLPIHPELTKAGFVRYVDQVRSRGDQRLFPLLTPDKYGVLTSRWSKWWNGYLRKPIGIADRKKVFHSFRHTFRDACREAGLGEEVADALMGHAGEGTGRRYGRSFSLARLAEEISKIRYPGLEVPLLIQEPVKGPGTRN